MWELPHAMGQLCPGGAHKKGRFLDETTLLADTRVSGYWKHFLTTCPLSSLTSIKDSGCSSPGSSGWYLSPG